MKKASEYRAHAEECRQLAAAMELGDQRDQLLEMAANWERLANERCDLVRRHPELGRADDRAPGVDASVISGSETRRTAASR